MKNNHKALSSITLPPDINFLNEIIVIFNNYLKSQKPSSEDLLLIQSLVNPIFAYAGESDPVNDEDNSLQSIPLLTINQQGSPQLFNELIQELSQKLAVDDSSNTTNSKKLTKKASVKFLTKKVADDLKYFLNKIPKHAKLVKQLNKVLNDKVRVNKIIEKFTTEELPMQNTKSVDQPAIFQNSPKEIMHEIFQYVNPINTAQLMRTCGFFNIVLNECPMARLFTA